MVRNIRVEVDDAVFEEYKQRKDELGLSWEEALRRGLQDKTLIEFLQESQTPLEALGASDPLGRQLLNQVAPSKPDDTDSLEARVEQLQETESAMLTFDFLERPRQQIPVQIIVHTSSSGHDIEVVSVQTTDTGTNRFNQEDRDKIRQEIADENVVLSLNNGREQYYVDPRLTWQNSDGGDLVVSNVVIENIRPFDEEND
jgi:hypothetical protein